MIEIAVVNILSAVLLLSFAAVAWRRPRVQGARELAALMLALGWWSTFEAALNVSAGLAAKLFWTQMEYVGVGLSAPLFLRFARAYTGSRGRLSRMVLAVATPVCLATVTFIWINPLHPLMWPTAALDATGSLLVLSRGPWFWGFAAAAYSALFTGAASVARLVLRTGGRLRTQALVVLAASLLPWAGNALYIGRILAIPGLDWTPIVFSVTGLLTTFATFRLGFLELVPIARGTVVDTMSDGVLVLDDEGRLVDYNPAAARLAGIRAGGARSAFPTLCEPLARVIAGGGGEQQGEVELDVEGKARTVELRASALVLRSGRQLGRLVVLRDITERRAAERERERLLADLKSAAAEISTLRGLLPICSSCKRVRDDQGYWSQIETYISRYADVRFSHGLCPDCAKRLYPEVFDKTPHDGA